MQPLAYGDVLDEDWVVVASPAGEPGFSVHGLSSCATQA